MENKITFPIPPGFSIPEDSTLGEPFEVMATVVASEDGKLTMSAIDGVPVVSAEGEEDSKEADADMEAPAGEGFLAAVEEGAKNIKSA